MSERYAKLILVQGKTQFWSFKDLSAPNFDEIKKGEITTFCRHVVFATENPEEAADRLWAEMSKEESEYWEKIGELKKEVQDLKRFGKYEEADNLIKMAFRFRELNPDGELESIPPLHPQDREKWIATFVKVPGYQTVLVPEKD